MENELLIDCTGNDELLIRYYKMEVLETDAIPQMKTIIIEALKKSRDDLLYVDQAIEIIEKFGDTDMKIIWERAKEKLVSPYDPIDIYDIMLFRH